MQVTNVGFAKAQNLQCYVQVQDSRLDADVKRLRVKEIEAELKEADQIVRLNLSKSP